MGAWGEGMQANDSALDWIYTVDEGKWSFSKAFQKIVEQQDTAGALGVAEWLLDANKDLDIELDVVSKAGTKYPTVKSVVLAALEHELLPEELECWRDPAIRKEALLNFKNRIEGKPYDAKANPTMKKLRKDQTKD
jgi:hypothetical protein